MLVALLTVSTPLLAGVSEIGAPGIPGPLVVHGESAQVIVSAKQGKFQEPVVASAIFGKGRIVAFGHGGYFGQAVFGQGQTKQFLSNAIDWTMPRGGVVGIHRASDVEALLREKGLPSKRLSEMDLANLDGIDLLVIDPNGESPKHTAVIQKFVSDGGGLMIAGLGWGWLQLNPGKRIAEHPCNRIASAMGIAWGDGYLERNSVAGFSAVGSPLAHAARAYEAVITGNENGTVGQVLTRAVETLPLDHPIISGIDKMASQAAVLPSENKPIKSADVLPRLKLALDLRRIREASPAEQKPHPAARLFPGEIREAALVVTRTIDIDESRPRWHGTGLYAPAGAVIRVTAEAPNLRVRIGTHSDRLWHLDDWKRAPEIDLSLPLKTGGMDIASAFGGPIYIDVTDAAPKISKVTISGAIEAPRFILGKTTLEEWRLSRHSAAPWAELESGKVILTVPSAHVRTLDNPIRLMEYWDKVADACADLATIPRERKSPERYVADVQISAGYMHAGYPIMTHLDAAPRMVDYAFMTDPVKGGDWGLFHEIGHNHQHPDWTFDGTGEVTVNLFTLYIIETVVGRVPGYKVRWTDEEIAETFRKHRSLGAPFDKWKSDPFLALTMYVQLQKAFGWDAYKKVFAEYRGLPASERPKNDAEKRDQWMVRFSNAVGKNLGPFFQAWGVPISAQARTSVKHLPTWDFSQAAD